MILNHVLAGSPVAYTNSIYYEITWNCKKRLKTPWTAANWFVLSLYSGGIQIATPTKIIHSTGHLRSWPSFKYILRSSLRIQIGAGATQAYHHNDTLGVSWIIRAHQLIITSQLLIMILTFATPYSSLAFLTTYSCPPCKLPLALIPAARFHKIAM